MSFWKKIKRAVKSWIDKTAESNKRQFGSSPPDCCGKKHTEGTK